ncbi:MAG: hypothetical protein MI923_30215 [Phycisphaerales bacterium]|nr:hypothetical protein [Phycisphaerales bacterium]
MIASKLSTHAAGFGALVIRIAGPLLVLGLLKAEARDGHRFDKERPIRRFLFCEYCTVR